MTQFQAAPAAPAAGQHAAEARMEIFAEANRRGAGRGNQGGNARPADLMFSEADRAKIRDAKNVYVAGFSSQGGGHTARMLEPLGKAVQPGDTVVLVLPPHWEVDTGNEHNKLGQYKADYQAKGVNVVTAQSDKAIWGFYEDNGPSDNFRILEEFAEKPNRDNSQTPLFGPAPREAAQTGQGFSHHDIMAQVKDAVGADNMDKVTVFEDMDPYLGKAAAEAGISKDHIVGQSNHLLLLDADDYFGEKSDAFLVKANGNGHNGEIATVEFDANINTTASLGKSLDNLHIRPEHEAVNARKQMVQLLLDHGNKHNLASDAPVSTRGAVLVSPDATAETVDRGVYIYLNKYTDPLAQHIRERLNGGGDTTPEQQAAYKKGMFVVCGAGTFAPTTHANAMHVGQAANFDAVTAAGFGTSSEMHYLISNDAYAGKLLLMPVERQHEQEANAEVLLPAALGDRADRVDTAHNIGELRQKLDDLMVNTATTNEVLGNRTMASLHEATHRGGAQATDKASQSLTRTREMNADEARLLNENTERAEDPSRKALRRLNKVMIPALKAMSQGSAFVDVRMTAKENPRNISVPDLIRALRDPNLASALMGADFSSAEAQEASNHFADKLEELRNIPAGHQRNQAAETYMRGEYANDKFTVGY